MTTSEDESANRITTAVGAVCDGFPAWDVLRALVACMSNAVCSSARNETVADEQADRVAFLLRMQIRKDFPLIKKQMAENTAGARHIPIRALT